MPGLFDEWDMELKQSPSASGGGLFDEWDQELAEEQQEPATGSDDQKLQAYVDQYNKQNPKNPITIDDIPDREGFWGRASELAHGVGHAVIDQFPEDMARIVQGGDVKLKDNSVLQGIIDEQQKDRASRVMSKQMIQGDTLAESLYQGPASVATSAVVGAGGAITGAKGGALIGGATGGPGGAAVGGTLGAMGGAFLSTGPSFYRMAKNQFLHEMLDVAKQKDLNLTEAEWTEIKADIDDVATEYGLWEAGPEAISQGLTAGLLKGVGGKIFGKIPGLSKVTEGISKRAVTRIGAKLAAEVAEEEVTEYTTFQGQEGIRKGMGLRKTDPTLGEFIDTQAGPVAVGSVLQMGVHKAGNSVMDLMKGEKQKPDNDESTEDTRTFKPETIDLLDDTEPAALPASQQLALPAGSDAIPQPTAQTGYGPIPQDDGTRRQQEAMPVGEPEPLGLPQAKNTYPPIVAEQPQGPPIEVYSPNFELAENHTPDFELVDDSQRRDLPAVPAYPMGLALAKEQPSAITVQANEAATSQVNDKPQPTKAQQEAGNYKLGHVKVAGLDISIENPAGSERSGTDQDGKPWSVQMQHHYGYIKGTVGRDKDHLDIFLKDGV